jgi:hypothetical protein
MDKSPTSVYRIDEKVFFTFGGIAFFCLLILGFRYKSYEYCEPIKLTSTSTNYYNKTLITFKADTKSGKRFEWYFGDDTRPVYGGSSITHAYEKAGRYTVNVTINGRCEEVMNVNITEAPLIVHPYHALQIEGPDTALINVPVTFLDMTPDANSWEWRFGNSQVIESDSKEATYTFTTEGNQQVFLRINGSPERYTIRNIYIKDPRPKEDNTAVGSKFPRKPSNSLRLPGMPDAPGSHPLGEGDVLKDEAPKEAPKAVRDVPVEEIGSFLEDIVSGKKQAGDFSEYLCGDLDLTVKYNNQSMKFTKMCEQLRDIKKVNRISKPVVVVGKDKSTNCIKTMDVTVRKKNLFQRIID